MAITLGDDQTVYHALKHQANEIGERTALVFVSSPELPTKQWTYSALFRRCVQTANLFTSLGATRTSPIAYLLPAMAETHFVVWGAEMVSIACPINPFLEVSAIAGLLRTCGARLLVALGDTPGSDIWQKAEQVRHLCPELRTVIAVGSQAGPDAINFAEGVAAQTCDRLLSTTPADPDAIAAYIHTGGTTSLPRFAPQTHKRQLLAAAMAAESFAIGCEDRIASGMPLFHVGGLYMAGLVPLIAGASILQLEGAGYRDQKMMTAFWDIIDNEKVTVISGVPTVYNNLAEIPIRGADLSRVRYAISSASGLPSQVRQRFEERSGIPIRECYGLTEATFVVTADSPPNTPQSGSVGRPLQHLDVKIMTESTAGNFRQSETGETGLLTVGGPTVFEGYLDGIENPNMWIEGRFNTGDLARMDENEYVTITGRAKDVIIRGGHNIDPQMIEESLLAHPAVLLAAAVGKPDPRVGELPVAYVQLHEDALADPCELIEFVAQTIGERAAVPKNIWIVEKIPLTGVGKISKPPLRRDAANKTFLELLRVAGLDQAIRSLEARDDPEHGLTVDIYLRESETNLRQSVQKLLSRFPYHIVFRQD